MNVAIGAKCWNGERRKSLNEVMKENKINDRFLEEAKSVNDPKMKMILGYIVPFMLLAGVLSSFWFKCFSV